MRIRHRTSGLCNWLRPLRQPYRTILSSSIRGVRFCYDLGVGKKLSWILNKPCRGRGRPVASIALWRLPMGNWGNPILPRNIAAWPKPPGDDDNGVSHLNCPARTRHSAMTLTCERTGDRRSESWIRSGLAVFASALLRKRRRMMLSTWAREFGDGWNASVGPGPLTGCQQSLRSRRSALARL